MPENRPRENHIPEWIVSDAAGVVLCVRVIPRAGRTDVGGVRDGALLVRLAAAPVDGAANDALTAWLADALRVPRRSIVLLSGERSRNKRVRISGLSPQAVADRLAALLR